MKLSYRLKAWFTICYAVTVCYASSATACTQSNMDEVSRASELMREFLAKNSICTSIGTNSNRARCWQKSPLTTEELGNYKALDFQYASSLATCNWDSIRYNLGNFRQSFGFECEAFSAFSDIKDLSRYRDIKRMMADAALQCAINSKNTDSFDDKRVQLRDFVAEAINSYTNNSAEQRSSTGRLLGIWRDYFSLGTESSDSTTIAKSIHSSDDEWKTWTSFLEGLRKHLISWRGSLFPNKNDINVTARQYGLAISKLTKQYR